LIRPIADFLVPVFFVLMGLRTDLSAFAEPGALGLTATLIVAAILGKQACALGVRTPGVNRMAVGIGMIPRGEVGLIFANVGAGLSLNGVPVISASTFSAVVAMVEPDAREASGRKGSAFFRDGCLRRRGCNRTFDHHASNEQGHDAHRDR
jgi:Kef-type K+ transport system membrane component KefB